MSELTLFETFWLVLIAAGAILAAASMHGIWLVVVSGVILDTVAGTSKSWVLPVTLLAVAAASQFLPRLLPRRLHGSQRGNLMIGAGAIVGALLAGLPCMHYALPVMATAVAVGTLAGAYAMEYRRRLQMDEDVDEDEPHQSFRPLSVLGRIVTVWFRTALALSLSLWLIRRVVFQPHPLL